MSATAVISGHRRGGQPGGNRTDASRAGHVRVRAGDRVGMSEPSRRGEPARREHARGVAPVESRSWHGGRGSASTCSPS